MSTPRTDDDLVRLALGGDREAMSLLIERHWIGVHAEAKRILRSDEAAEDLAQEACLLATLHLARLREADRFGGWIRTIARNMALSWRRSGTRADRLASRIPLEDETMQSIPDNAPSAAEVLSLAQDNAALRAALARLAEEDRLLVTRHYMQQESQRQIAESMGVNHSTISRRIELALRKLHGLLAPRPSGVQRARLLCAAAIALPAASRAALVQQTSAEAARLTLPTWLTFLHPAVAATAAGAIAMTTIQKTIAVAALAALIGGGALYHRTAEPTPTRTVAATTGQEVAIDLARGETVRMTFDTIDYPKNEMAGYVSDYESIVLTGGQNGTVTARVTKRSGGEQTVTLTPGSKDLTNFHIWQEMNLLLFTSAVSEATATGSRVTFFRANRPELLPAAKALEVRLSSGRITRTQYLGEMESFLDTNSLLPKNKANRDAVLGLMAE